MRYRLIKYMPQDICLSPISEGDIARELTFIYGDEPKQKFRVQTFGGFESFRK